MNILALYPGLSMGKNDVAQMLVELSNQGVRMSVIASRALVQKGKGALPPYEDMDGIPIYRMFKRPFNMFAFPHTKLKQCLRIAAKLKPDLIFCSQELNMRLALELQKFIRVPIVLLVEDAGRIRSGEAYRSLPLNFFMASKGIPTGPKFWSWLCKKASAIITCHPRDKNKLESFSLFGKPVHYLPWPTYLPADFEQPLVKKRYRGIFVGSLNPFKNTQEFEQTLPRILKETCTEEFVVVGPGLHAKIIQKLQRDTDGAVRHVYGVPRDKALYMIAESYYAYSPVIVGGWGFIGDCWSVKTPLVMSHNDNYVSNNVNALVSENCDALISNINRLYDDEECYRALQQNGIEESNKKTVKVVSTELYRIFQRTIGCQINSC